MTEKSRPHPSAPSKPPATSEREDPGIQQLLDDATAVDKENQQRMKDTVQLEKDRAKALKKMRDAAKHSNRDIDFS